MIPHWFESISMLPLTMALCIAVLIGLWAVHAVQRRRAERAEPNLIGRALRHRGLTPADAERAGWESALMEAQERCSGCTATARCRSDLDAGQGPLDGSACPNAALFAGWTQQRETGAARSRRSGQNPGSPGVL